MLKCYRCDSYYFELDGVPELRVSDIYSGVSENIYNLCDHCQKDLRAFLSGSRIESKNHSRSRQSRYSEDVDWEKEN